MILALFIKAADDIWTQIKPDPQRNDLNHARALLDHCVDEFLPMVDSAKAFGDRLLAKHGSGHAASAIKEHSDIWDEKRRDIPKEIAELQLAVRTGSHHQLKQSINVFISAARALEDATSGLLYEIADLPGLRSPKSQMERSLIFISIGNASLPRELNHPAGAPRQRPLLHFTR